jgi:putative N-acetyltransferase (TIGR04045 family)
MLHAPRVAVECRPARTAEELAAYHAVRHQVFVEEQCVFAGSDRDGHDDDARTIHVVGFVGSTVGGTVRLFPLDPAGRLWQGDRLAVLPECRTSGLGGPLVRHAVRTAGELGGDRMVAHIQMPNVVFFEHLGWARDGAVEVYAGLPHQPMTIDLRNP